MKFSKRKRSLLKLILIYLAVVIAIYLVNLLVASFSEEKPAEPQQQSHIIL